MEAELFSFEFLKSRDPWFTILNTPSPRITMPITTDATVLNPDFFGAAGAAAAGGMTGDGAGTNAEGIIAAGAGGDDRGGGGGATAGGGGGPGLTGGAPITIPGTVESGAQPAAPSYQARSLGASDPSFN
jgi:hypothetical protein